MVGLLGGEDWGVGGEREVDAGIRNQIRLELGQVDVQRAVEPKRRWQEGKGKRDSSDSSTVSELPYSTLQNRPNY